MYKMTLLFGFILLTIPCAAGTINVNWDGTGNYTTIQAGIDAAVNGDIVIVAEGTYYEQIDFNGPDIILTSTNPDDPLVVAATIIDGSASGAGYVVEFSGSETAACELTGFTISNKAGIRGKGTTAKILNCVITDNFGGEAGGIEWCNGKIKNCTISNNSGVLAGGLYECHGIIEYCTIIGNSALGDSYSDGAGGGLRECDGVIRYCLISNNYAEDSGGGLFYCLGTVTKCTIRDNTAGYGGGGIYTGHDITNCIITGNSARIGGGIYDGDSREIRNCIIMNNSATLYGGGLYADGDVINCLIAGNTAGDDGGGLSCSQYNDFTTMTNCTIVNNQAISGNGGGVYHCGTAITNCIFRNNTAGGSGQDMYDSVVPNFSCFVGGFSSGDIRNIDVDPLFVSGISGDYYLSQIAAGQASESFCVHWNNDMAANLGLDTLTTRTDQVTDSGLADMGYHYHINPVDINDDGTVNIIDFAILSSQWNGSPGVPSADIYPIGGDGFVNIYDLRALMQYWLWPE
jgi:predicted outer membrane repeat protein